MADTKAITNVVIVGAGPAGLTAAIYLSRDQIQTLVIEKDIPGGQILTTKMVENYPGFPEGIDGGELAERLRKQAERFGACILTDDEVTKIENEGDLRKLITPKQELLARTVIIASGSAYRMLDVPGCKELTGSGVSYCAVCDAAFYEGKTIAVVGGGNAAIDESLMLAKFVDKIYMIEVGERLRADRGPTEELLATGKVEVLLQHEVQAIRGTTSVEGIEVIDKKSGDAKELDVQGVFIFIGRIPSTGFLKGYLQLDQQGFIETPCGSLETSRKNVFAAGDVRSGARAQITTAAGEGTIAAFFVRESLRTIPQA